MRNYILLSFFLIPFIVKSQDDCSVKGLVVQCKTTPTATYNGYDTRTICQLPGVYLRKNWW
jgi:hypothetical protein